MLLEKLAVVLADLIVIVDFTFQYQTCLIVVVADLQLLGITNLQLLYRRYKNVKVPTYQKNGYTAAALSSGL